MSLGFEDVTDTKINQRRGEWLFDRRPVGFISAYVVI